MELTAPRLCYVHGSSGNRGCSRLFPQGGLHRSSPSATRLNLASLPFRPHWSQCVAPKAILPDHTYTILVVLFEADTTDFRVYGRKNGSSCSGVQPHGTGSNGCRCHEQCKRAQEGPLRVTSRVKAGASINHSCAFWKAC